MHDEILSTPKSVITGTAQRPALANAGKLRDQSGLARRFATSSLTCQEELAG